MKTTKKAIQEILRSGNRTEIFKVAKLKGFDVKNRTVVCDFIRHFAPSDKVRRKAIDIAYYKNSQYSVCKEGKNNLSPALKAIQFAKMQKKEGKSSYSKVLIEGNRNIYWASPEYLHRDYNKHSAFENTPKFQAIAKTINRFLNY
jgi:cell division protein YceG involved in septum cleavage